MLLLKSFVTVKKDFRSVTPAGAILFAILSLQAFAVEQSGAILLGGTDAAKHKNHVNNHLSGSDRLCFADNSIRLDSMVSGFKTGTAQANGNQ